MMPADSRERAGVGVDVVGETEQGAAHDSLTDQLGAEGADAENLGDGVGVAPLGQDRDGDEAPDLLADNQLQRPLRHSFGR